MSELYETHFASDGVIARMAELQSQVEQLQKQLKAMTEERDCWIANAKNLQVGYNDLDKRIRMMNNSTWPLPLNEK